MLFKFIVMVRCNSPLFPKGNHVGFADIYKALTNLSYTCVDLRILGHGVYGGMDML